MTEPIASAVTYEKVMFELIQLYASAHLPTGIWRTQVEVNRALDAYAEDLTLTMKAVVYGRTGKTVTASKRVRIAKFPAWLPPFLAKRWSDERDICLDATPLLIWPDATWAPPEFGRHVEIMRPGYLHEVPAATRDPNEGWL